MSLDGIKDQIFGGSNNNSSTEEAMCILMKEYGLSYTDIVGGEVKESNHFLFFGFKLFEIKRTTVREGLPLPVFYQLIDLLVKESKMNEKAMNKSKGKGR